MLDIFFIFEHRAMFIHVAIPGQEPGASDLTNEFKFPKMKDLGLNLVSILDNLRVPHVVGLGNGAGANIITRYGASPCLECYLRFTSGLVWLTPAESTVLLPLTIQPPSALAGLWRG
jgi:hypothetical protein